MTWRHVGQGERVEPDAIGRAVALFGDELRRATFRHEHYFLALVGFRVAPPLSEVVLDHENIRVAPSIGCFICEQVWTPTMGARCPGDPS